MSTSDFYILVDDTPGSERYRAARGDDVAASELYVLVDDTPGSERYALAPREAVLVERVCRAAVPLASPMRVLLPDGRGGTVVRTGRASLAIHRDDGAMLDLDGVPDLFDRATFLLCVDVAEDRRVARSETILAWRGKDRWDDEGARASTVAALARALAAHPRERGSPC